MSGTIQTIKGASRYYKITPDAASLPGSPLLEIGPAGTTASVAVLTVQFKPSINWNGQFVVCGRTMGPAADSHDMPFLPIPYKRVNLANIAQDYAIVTDPIVGTALIEVPANGRSIALLFTCLDGSCEIASWDVQGSAAVR